MSFHVLAEALARIEHKMDLILQQEKKRNPQLLIPPVGAFLHNCPVCSEQVKYIVDPILAVLIRKCGCKTGMQAPINLEAFKPPSAAGDTHGRSRYEDGNDSGDDGGSGGSSSARRR